MREARTKAKELLIKLEPDERLVVGTAYCGQKMSWISEELANLIHVLISDTAKEYSLCFF